MKYQKQNVRKPNFKHKILYSCAIDLEILTLIQLANKRREILVGTRSLSIKLESRSHIMLVSVYTQVFDSW